MRKGFSLLELIIYVAVTIIIVTLLSDVVVTMLRVRERNLAQREVQQNLRFVMSRIERALTQATAVSGTYPGNTLTLTIDSATTTFVLSGGAIVLTEGANPSVTLTTTKVTAAAISTNIFTKATNTSPASSSIQVQLKISYNDGGKPSLVYSASAQTTVELRQI